MLNRIKKVLTSKQGISLLETLIALTILTIIAFCFLPLFSQYMTHIKKAGNLQQETQYKTSLMERLIANKGGNPAGYEVGAGTIPLTFYCGGDEISFNTETSNTIKGTIIKSDDNDSIGGGNTYVTLTANSAAAHMACFPNELTDDFIQKDIYVVAKGFKFNESAFTNSSQSGGWHFAVAYTDSDGSRKTLSDAYYDVTSEDDNGELIAKFTFYGGNEFVSFEKSPFIIGYGTGSGVTNLQYTTELRVSAPEIIFVGEKAKNAKGEDDDYYYYATAGVDENGNMDIIAKQMSGDAKLKSAMNDVEWVEEGRGDDGNGGVNDYGYYVMGGDAGQVRRFWKNDTTGNYYWGGDNLVNYNRYAYLKENGTKENDAYENMTEAKTTQASFKSIFRSPQKEITVNGIPVNRVFHSTKTVTIINNGYRAISTNYFTANVGAEEYNKYFLTLGVVAKFRGGYEYYGADPNASSSEYPKLASWLTGGQTHASKLNVDGYKAATNYEYPEDNSLITITSVGAVQINTSNSNYSASQANTAFNQHVYPTKSYTLYCGYIPAVVDLWALKNRAFLSGYNNIYGHSATLGVGYCNDSWYPIGKFGDIHTVSKTVSRSVVSSDDDLSYKKLLNFINEKTENRDSLYPYNGKEIYYQAGISNNGVTAKGLPLPAEGNDYYITDGEEVDITIGYLSHPFAISLNNPEYPVIKGTTGSDWYFKSFNGAGTYDHSFFSAGLRDNVTMLDVKSFYDDLTRNNISFAVGYSVGYLFSDAHYQNHLSQVYNNGIVYVRSTGDGSESDETGNLSSGKGWSLKKETNVFHEFYGISQYQDGSGVETAQKWNTNDHRAYFNIADNSNGDGKDEYYPGGSESKAPTKTYGSQYGTNCHPMAQTECTTVNKGVTWDEKPDIMWGTSNGTLMGWTYDYEDLAGSKITAVRKEFESYIWADRIGEKRENHYDYNRITSNDHTTSGFISVLSSINDVAYGDGFWVAVGNQSGKNPADYCTENCVTDTGVGSYINVKYDTGNFQKITSKAGSETSEVLAPIYAWKAVKVSDKDNINFVSVTYSRGVWYAMGYEDENHDGENDRDGDSYIFYSRDPAKGWERAKTRNAKGEYTYDTNALLFDAASGGDGEVKEIKLTGLNSMASRG